MSGMCVYLFNSHRYSKRRYTPARTKSVPGWATPPVVRGQGKTKLDCTMYPTKAAIATRPCLISDSRRYWIDFSLSRPKRPTSTRSRGSQYLTTGLSSTAIFSRSTCMCRGVSLVRRTKHNPFDRSRGEKHQQNRDEERSFVVRVSVTKTATNDYDFDAQ